MSGGKGTVPTRSVPRFKASVATFVLTVRDGPDAGKSLRIDGSQPFRILVGTSPVCSFRLTDPMISRRHAALDSAGAELRLTDLRSTNGTRANGVVVIEAHLFGGETLQLGGTRISVERAEAMASVPLSSASAFGRVFGTSESMRRLYPVFERTAVGEDAVLLDGEVGTGKELLAETLHERGARSTGPFVMFDTATTPLARIEAVLFGDPRDSALRGALEQASGGTLFIADVGDLPPRAQARLARALETGEREVRDVPGAREPLDCRVIVATSKNLDEEIQDNRFDAALFARLCAGRIELPPLRRREGDAVFLAGRFWRALAGDGSDAPEDLLADVARQTFPGNVAELHALVVQRVSRDDAPAREGKDLVPSILAQDLPLPRARQLLIAEFERLYVDRVVEKHGGHVAQASAASGLALRYFQLLRARQRRRSEP